MESHHDAKGLLRTKICEFTQIRVRAKMPITKGNIAVAKCTAARPGDSLVATGYFPITVPNTEALSTLFSALDQPGVEVTCNATIQELFQGEADMRECADNMRRLREAMCDINFQVQQ